MKYVWQILTNSVRVAGGFVFGVLYACWSSHNAWDIAWIIVVILIMANPVNDEEMT